MDAEQKLDLVRSWFNRALSGEESAIAEAMILKGDPPPYIARCLMVQAEAGKPKEGTTEA